MRALFIFSVSYLGYCIMCWVTGEKCGQTTENRIPEKSDAERKAIAKKFYRNFVR